MAVLYPKIVNAYSKFAQNRVYYKRNFSVLSKKHTTLLSKNARHIVKTTWPYRESTSFVRFSQTEWCVFLMWLWNEFGISALLFWHTDVYTKFAYICATKVKRMFCDFRIFRFVRNLEEIFFSADVVK